MKNLKNIALLTFVLALFAGVQLIGQTTTTPPAKNTIIKIKTSAECEMCKERIEKEVSLMKGVKKAELDVATKILTVEYNSKKTSAEKIKKAISNIGYDADEVKANNRATKNLPHCCQPKVDSVAH